MNSDMKRMIYKEYWFPKKTEGLAKVFTAEWLVPAGLIMLSAIPVVGGAVRIVELTGGAAASSNTHLLSRAFPPAMSPRLQIYSI